MFVAVIESMLNRRIKNIVRVPKRRFDYVRNAQSVIDVLSVVLQSKLQVSAQQISEGHLPSICNLVSVFSRTIELIASKRLKIPESLLDASLFVSSRQSGRAGVRIFYVPSLFYLHLRRTHTGVRGCERRRLPEDEGVVSEQSSLFQCTEKVVSTCLEVERMIVITTRFHRADTIVRSNCWEERVRSQQSSKMNDVQDEENLPPSYSEDTLLPRRRRNRMANLLRLSVSSRLRYVYNCINSLFHMNHTHSQHSYRHTIDNNFVLENSFVCWRNHNVTVKSSIV